MTPLRSALLIVTLAAATSAARASTAVVAADHVAGVAAHLAPHLPRAGSPPPVVLTEKAAALAGVTEGELWITTGLLAALDSDAELAMILAYEQCRALPAAERRGDGRATSAGVQVARAALAGAAVGAVAYGVDEVLDSSDPFVRGAAVGAATASTGVAVSLAIGNRRGARSQDAADDRDAADGMRALVAAGFDGQAALRAWDRFGSVAALGGDEGGYADAKANRKRRDAAAKALRSTGQASSPQSGFAIGTESYHQNVTRALAGWSFAEPVPAAGESEAAMPGDSAAPVVPADGRQPWIVYHRSGGFTGWVAELRVYDDGSRWVSESQRAGDAGPRPAIPAEQFESLRALVDAASTKPPRRPSPEGRWLRDGQVRSLEVPAPEGRKSLTLSDGMVLTDEDHRLVKMLEDMLR